MTSESPATTASRAAETAARDAYGRTLAQLAWWSGDLAGAEDALADALVAALERWPSDGVPRNPQGWLVTAARRRRIDGARHQARSAALAERLGELEAQPNDDNAGGLPDRRLDLLLACAHPGVHATSRTPLMLQAVLGLSAERIASAFLVSPATMTKRLVRAKAKIQSSGVRFEVPEAGVLAERLDPLLNAIYAAFTLAHGADAADEDPRDDLATEAIWLARLVASLLPDKPEALGLLSLLLLVDARRPARRDAQGGFVRLSAQDTGLWTAAEMDEAETILRRAGAMGAPGRFQLEAAVQAVHANRRRSGSTDWGAIATLYDRLVATRPTLGALVARAAALGLAEGPRAGLMALDAIPPAEIAAYAAFWATRAHLLAETDDLAPAVATFRRAAGLTDNTAWRAHLLARAEALWRQL